MASSDNAILYGLREATFGTPATVATDTATAAAVSTDSGDEVVTFTVTTGTNFAAGQIVSVSGFTGAAADYDGTYLVKSVGSTSVVCYCPAGKTELASAGSASATIGNHVPVRYSGSDSLALTPGRSPSDEITGSRGAEDMQEDGRSAGGGFSGPFALPWLDSYVQMLSGSAWTYAGTNAEIFSGGSSPTLAVSGGGVTLTQSTGDWSANVAVGDMVKCIGGTNDGATGMVTARTATTITLSHSSFVNMSAESTPDLVVADYLTDGSTIYSETLERRYNDITGGSAHYPQFPGSVLDALSISASAQSSPTYQMTWQCADETSPTPTSSMGTVAPKVVGSRVRGDRVKVWIDASTGGCVQDMTLNWANNLDPRVCLGSSAVSGMDMRALDITASVSRRYETAGQYDKFLALTDASMLIKFESTAGPTLVCWLEKGKYSSASRGAASRNSALIGSLEFTALELPAGYTAKWFRWGR